MDIGPYAVGEELGRGGMGVVYRAHHRELDRTVALKVIAPDGSADPAALQRFQREAQAAAALAAHPGIVGAHDQGVTPEGAAWFAMEFVPGRSLAEHLEQADVAPTQSAAWIAAAARAVHHAHTQGVVHRDLKPGNLLLATDGRVRVADFGLAAWQRVGPEAARLTRSDDLVGTPAYMAPEQVLGAPPTPAADVWALGATLHHCVSGRPPFGAGPLLQVLHGVTAGDPAPIPSDVPAPLQWIVARCLQKDPAARYATALALAEDLERFARGAPTEAQPPGAVARLVAWSRRRRSWIAGVATAVALVGIWSWALSGLLGPDPAPPPASQPAGTVVATTRAHGLVEAWRALRSATVDPMRELEDAWHRRGVVPTDTAPALQAVQAACARLRNDTPDSRLPEAWEAWAHAYAATDGLPLRSLQSLAESAGDDPYPRVVWVRALLARYVAAVELPPVRLSRGVTHLGALPVSAQGRADLDQARAVLQALATDPVLAQDHGGTPLRWFLRGALAVADGDFAGAAELLSGAGDDPLLAGDATLLRALALLQLDRPGEAAELFESLRDRGWPDANEKASLAWLSLAQRSLQSGMPAQDYITRGLAVLDDTVQRFPGDANSWVNRAIGRETVAALAELRGEDPGVWHQRALADLDHALTLVPGATRVLHTRGAVRVQFAQDLRRDPAAALAELDRAIADLTAAIASDDGYALAWLGRSQARRLRARWLVPLGRDPTAALTGSVEDADRAMALAPDSLEALAQRANALASLGDRLLATGGASARVFARAVDDRIALVTARPEDPRHRLDLGVARLGLASARAADGTDAGTLWDEARADFEAAVTAMPEYAPAARRLGQCRLLAAVDGARRGADRVAGVTAALAALDQCLRLAPDDAAAWLWRAKAHDFGGDRAAALADLAAAERLRPGHPEQAALRRLWSR